MKIILTCNRYIQRVIIPSGQLVGVRHKSLPPKMVGLYCTTVTTVAIILCYFCNIG